MPLACPHHSRFLSTSVLHYVSVLMVVGHRTRMLRRVRQPVVALPRQNTKSTSRSVFPCVSCFANCFSLLVQSPCVCHLVFGYSVKMDDGIGAEGLHANANHMKRGNKALLLTGKESARLFYGCALASLAFMKTM